MRPNPFEKASRKHFEFFEVLLSLTSSLIRFGNSETLGTRFRERRFSGARKLAHHVRVSLCYDIAIDTILTHAVILIEIVQTLNVFPITDIGFILSATRALIIVRTRTGVQPIDCCSGLDGVVVLDMAPKDRKTFRGKTDNG